MTKTQSANKKENEYLLHILYYLMFLLHNVYVFIGTYVTLTLVCGRKVDQMAVVIA